MKKVLLILCSTIAMVQFVCADTFVRYNLAGYYPDREKVAIVMSDVDLTSQSWTVSRGGVPVIIGPFDGSVVGRTKFTALPYNYEIDFSHISIEGEYTIHVPGAEIVNVSVKNNPYGHIANEMLRMLRVKRSGSNDALDHAKSHMGDAQALYYHVDGVVGNGQWKVSDDGGFSDMLGGWYDAGDYIKFTLTIAQTINVLLEAYQANPDIFIQQYSRSNYIDILDEIKFGLDYLMKTMPNDNEFIIQVSTGLDHMGVENFRLPEHDERDGEREALSALSPSHMAVTAAALAFGAKVFQSINEELSITYKNKAIAIYHRSLETDVLHANAFERDATNDFYKDDSINNERALAAARLYELTGEASYKASAITFGRTHGQFNALYSGLDYYFSESDSILMAYKVLGKGDADAQHLAKIELDAHLAYSNAKGNIWGTAQIPDWGNLANSLYIAGTAAEDLVRYGDSYYKKLAFDNIDYLLGRNPWGISFVLSPGLSKIPTEWHSQIYRLQPEKTPIGMIVNGPSKPKYINADTDIVISPTAWEHQFNTTDMVDGQDEGINFFDNWKNYTGTEPTIFGQATGIYAIAALSKLERQGLALRSNDGTQPAMKSPPAGLAVEKVPLFVTLGSDDNQSSAGVRYLYELVNGTMNHQGLSNPFTFDGQSAKMTFLNTGANASGAGAEWLAAHRNGNETANHTQTHNSGGPGYNLSYRAWQDEIRNANNAIVGVGIPSNALYGFRAPRLEYSNTAIEVLNDEGFLYDSSIEDGYATGLDGTNYYWPYTLHAGSPGAIVKTTWDQANGTPFRIGSYPRVWELPVSPWIVPADDEDGLPYDLRAKIKEAISYFDMDSGKITAFDYNLLALARLDHSDDIFAILKHTLDLRLQGNRAPMVVGLHSKNYSEASSVMAVALRRFVEYAASHPEVRLASHKQVIDWMKNPRALDDIPHMITATITGHEVIDQCTESEWDATVTYVQGNKVTHDNQTWTSEWWNIGHVPGTEQWGPWHSSEDCSDTVTQYYGAITPQGSIAVNMHGSQHFSFIPDTGKRLQSVLVDGVAVNPVPVNGYTFSDVTGNHNVVVTFGDRDENIYTLSVTSGVGGAISPGSDVQVNEGASQLFTFIAASGYTLDQVTVDGMDVAVTNNQYHVQNVMANMSLTASFKLNEIPSHTINASSSAHGSISPEGGIQINTGEEQLYQFVPDVGYQVDVVTVNGQEVVINNDQFWLKNVTVDTTISVSFKKGINPNCFAAWDANTVYTNESVTFDGKNWTAKWWTRGHEPEYAKWGLPWLLLGDCE